MFDGWDILEARSGLALSAYQGNKTRAEVVHRIREALDRAEAQGLLDDDDREDLAKGELDLRVSLSGHVVTTMGTERGYLTTVAKQEWFPVGLR